MPLGLDGKVALVTGAASGIGRTTALTFAREGAKVVVADVDSSGGEETVTMIKDEGGDSAFVHADVSQARQVEAMVSQAVEIFGRLDTAHNNAGVASVKVPMADFDEEDWDREMSVNLKGVWLCMKYEIPQMVTQGGGAIVNTSSMSGLVGMKGSTAYGAAKFGVVGLTKIAALEYAESGIRVNAVCPGAIKTPLADQLMEKEPQREALYMAIHPVRRRGTPEEVAETVVWLCSDAASFVTGIAMPVDGGATSGPAYP